MEPLRPPADRGYHRQHRAGTDQPGEPNSPPAPFGHLSPAPSAPSSPTDAGYDLSLYSFLLAKGFQLHRSRERCPVCQLEFQPRDLGRSQCPAVRAGTSSLSYPILDPRSPTTSGLITLVGSPWITRPGPPANQPPPCPCAGSMSSAMARSFHRRRRHGTNSHLCQSSVKPRADNPIVGRTAFWTDDESCKINVNTAADGAFWDTPHVDALTNGRWPAASHGSRIQPLSRPSGNHLAKGYLHCAGYRSRHLSFGHGADIQSLQAASPLQ